MLLDEYILLAVECQLHNEKDNEIQTLLEKHTKTGKHSKRRGHKIFFTANLERSLSRYIFVVANWCNSNEYL